MLHPSYSSHYDLRAVLDTLALLSANAAACRHRGALITRKCHIQQYKCERFAALTAVLLGFPANLLPLSSCKSFTKGYS
jgi:hypothetical protein